MSIDLAPGAGAGLAALSRGRRLLIDWFSTRYCGGIWAGDVAFRWQRSDQPIDGYALRLAAPDGLDLWIRPELIALFARSRARLVIRRFGPLRRPGLVVENGEEWVDFFATCRRAVG